MEISSEAKAMLDRNVNGIKKKLNVYPGDVAEAEKEIRTMLFERAESNARERCSDVVNEEDVVKAGEILGSAEDIIDTLMASYSSKFKRAGLLSRAIAYIIDVVLAGVLVMVICIPAFLMSMGAGMLQDPFSITVWVLANLFMVVAAIIAYLAYFILLEEHFGRTPGKAIMGLKVLKTDGGKIGLKESILRNVPKFIENLVLIDALLMLIFFNKEKQRAFDKVANTMVIHA